MEKRTILLICLGVSLFLNLCLGVYLLKDYVKEGLFFSSSVESSSVSGSKHSSSSSLVSSTSSGSKSSSSSSFSSEVSSSEEDITVGDVINIAYSTDKNYIYPTFVSIYSILRNSDKDFTYNITVLCQPPITDEMRTLYGELELLFPNAKVNLVDMKDRFTNLPPSWYGLAMYYRLALGEILRDVRLCLYFDSDVMIRGNVTELLKRNMTGYYVAGTRDFNKEISEGSKYNEVVGIPELKTYISSGVLLLNLEEIRNNDMTQVITDILEKHAKSYTFPDQDALNKAFYGHIKHFPPNQVVLAHTLKVTAGYSKWIGMTEDEFKKLSEDPIVFHFTGPGKKPWKVIEGSFYREWWDLVDETSYKQKIHSMYGM